MELGFTFAVDMAASYQEVKFLKHLPGQGDEEKEISALSLQYIRQVAEARFFLARLSGPESVATETITSAFLPFAAVPEVGNPTRARSSMGCNGIEASQPNLAGVCQCNAGQGRGWHSTHCKRVVMLEDLLDEEIVEAASKATPNTVLEELKQQSLKDSPALLKQNVHLKCKRSNWMASLQCERTSIRCYCENEPSA